MDRDKAIKIKKAQEGDIDAFAEVFEELRPLVFSVAYRLVGPNDADDVLMETYLKAWKSIPGFNHRSGLKTWLYRITYNCAQDFLRKRQRESKHLVTSSDGTESIIDNLTDHDQQLPSAKMEADETKGIIEQALEILTEEHKITLLLRYAEELSYSEIAAATGVSIGTVMSRLFNGKRKLKKILENLEK